jgi:hypothetical protein
MSFDGEPYSEVSYRVRAARLAFVRPVGEETEGADAPTVRKLAAPRARGASARYRNALARMGRA